MLSPLTSCLAPHSLPRMRNETQIQRSTSRRMLINQHPVCVFAPFMCRVITQHIKAIENRNTMTKRRTLMVNSKKMWFVLKVLLRDEVTLKPDLRNLLLYYFLKAKSCLSTLFSYFVLRHFVTLQ